MTDLRKNKYSINILKENIYALDLWTLLETQTLDEEFAVNYILNKDFQLTTEEENIKLVDVFKLQPHLNYEKLVKLFIIGPDENLFDFLNH